MAVILVVDDNASLRDGIGLALSGSHSVIHAANGAEAIAQADKHKPAAVILDILLPDEHGVNLAMRLYEMLAAPIVAISGYVTADVLNLGPFADFIQKPFTAGELRTVMERVLISC